MAQEAAVIERRTIDFVPESERHGKVFSMFTLFFSGNMQITAVAIGVIPIELGLSLWWSVFALVLGNVLGGLSWRRMRCRAAHRHSAMIQSRAQFGVLGANIPLGFVVLMYLGFFSGSAILGGSALALMLGMSKPAGIIITNGLSFLLLALGYDTIHRYAKWAAYVFAAIFVVATILAFGRLADLPAAPVAATAAVSIPMLLIAISIFATWQVTYGPYVADYSRYMPRTTSSRAIFWNTYLGSVLGSAWAMIVGVLLAVLNQKLASADPTAAFSGLFSGSAAWLHGLVLLIVLAGVVVVNAMNLYGGALSSLTIISSGERMQRSTLQHGKWWRMGWA
jgi:Purine-cytosine permease and related proteins